MKAFNKSLKMLLFIFVFTLVSCNLLNFDEEVNTGSNATVKVTNVLPVKVGSKYSVKVSVAVSGLADGEYVKTIGAQMGYLRDSRSGQKSAVLTFSLSSKRGSYNITPFFKTNFTDKEVTGPVKTYRIP
ncbi:MAG: hypothetical protein J6R07_03860 [Bacteroidaceae bacterium]|nr:hypothetical protein [Bacteroidaceae bacterium]